VKDGIEIRQCHSLDEYEEGVRLERVIWGEDITVPAPIFVVADHTGGQVIGAFDGEKLVGMTLALAGFRSSLRFLHSHMTAVLPEYQNRGVGRRLKLFQRQDALKRGIPLVEWTFDPLELKNAHFNLVRLGAVARRYIPDWRNGKPAALWLANGPAGSGMVARFGARERNPGWEFAAGESGRAEDFCCRQYLGIEEERSSIGRTSAGFDASTLPETVRQGVCGDRD